jgi:DNA helicase-2/ATP-dependent DNA helicase PcrA
MWTIEPEIILGGPGTGKTTYLLGVLESELNDGIDPGRIAFLSFTKKAAGEAQDRAVQRFGFKKRDMDHFRTVHSMAYRETGVRRQEVLGHKDLREVCTLLGMSYTGRADVSEGPASGDTEADTCLSIISYARATCTPLEEAWRNTGEEVSWWELKRFDDTLRQYKTDTNKLDFNDMLSRYEADGEPLDVDVAIVDEAQDLSTAQWRVLQKALCKAKRIYVAGDDDQAIYRWSGADVDMFLDMEGSVTVLTQSHRLPAQVFNEAQRIVSRIKHRRPKEYAHTGKGGLVSWVSGPDDIPIEPNGETWMLLARNRHQLKLYEESCYAMGIPYRTPYKDSVDKDHVRAIIMWERLRKGKSIESRDANLVRECLGFDFDEPFPDTGLWNWKDFEVHGPARDIVWHDAFKGLNIHDREYYLNVLRAGFKLTDAAPVYVGTIHSVKGGEADNVVLRTDMTTRSYNSFQLAPDDEHRVFYVGATRSRKNLFMMSPLTDMFYTV